ncbi:unnamed protein product [Closterium sp. NIES-54]
MSLKETLKYERECSAVEKIDLQEEIEKMPAAPPSGNEQAPSKSGSADSASTGAGAKKRDEKPPKPPQTVDEARYELNVVQPRQEAKTVRDAWRLWNSATADDTHRLCDTVAEPGFVDCHTLLKGATQGAHDMKVRRMLKAMDAVHLLCSSDGDADTEAVVAALNKIAAGPSAMPLRCSNREPHRRSPRSLILWEEQMPKTVADMAKQTAHVLRPPTKRKKAA